MPKTDSKSIWVSCFEPLNGCEKAGSAAARWLYSYCGTGELPGSRPTASAHLARQGCCGETASGPFPAFAEGSRRRSRRHLPGALWPPLSLRHSLRAAGRRKPAQHAGLSSQRPLLGSLSRPGIDDLQKPQSHSSSCQTAYRQCGKFLMQPTVANNCHPSRGPSASCGGRGSRSRLRCRCGRRCASGLLLLRRGLGPTELDPWVYGVYDREKPGPGPPPFCRLWAPSLPTGKWSSLPSR